jgi:tRNA-specific 2-thiouridylase
MQTKQNISNQNKKVLVGISGGVDSSVSALLLIEQGYEVEGVFAKVWQPDFVECTWRDEMKDAMRVCAKLGIPFHFLDLEEKYKTHVADYMILEYQAGRTPNPDVMCNTHIKFGFMYEYAMQKGFEYIATGHYAQNIDGQLYRGADTTKDQSYFLWNIDTDKFKKILFPIGHLEKSKNNLFTAEKKDSQGLCFIGPVDMKSFLKKLITTTPGEVFNQKGECVGVHDGVQLYTIGERHGFRIFPTYKHTDEQPLFVIDKNIKENKLIVGSEALPVQKVTLQNVLLHGTLPDSGLIEVQCRYRQKPFSAKILKENSTYTLEFQEPYPTFVADGQSAVIYSGTHCLGGGIIGV